MLQLPEAPPYYRILSIDPGSDTLGIAMFDVDLQRFEAYLLDATTLQGARAVRQMPFLTETLGDRRARLQSHAHELGQILQQVQPHAVISEAAYMGRFAQAFESLVECLYMIRGVVSQYDPALPLETVDSPTAKKAVGAPGKRPKGMDSKAYKETVRLAVLQQTRLKISPQLNVQALDEHAIDAIAVGCYKIQCISDTIL